MVTTTAVPATEEPQVEEQTASVSPEQLDQLWKDPEPQRRYHPMWHCPQQKLRTVDALRRILAP